VRRLGPGSASLAAAGALLLAFLAHPEGWLGETLYLVGVNGATVMLWAGIRSRRPANRAPWTWLAIGVGLSGIADTLYSAYGWFFHQPDPAISLADPVYLASYWFLGVGLLGVARARAGERDLDALIDVTAVTVVGLLVAWEFLIKDSLQHDHLSVVANLVNPAYPVADVVLIALLVRLLLEDRIQSAVGSLLAAGMALWLFADVSYAVLVQTSAYSFGMRWLDGAWLAGPLLFGAAALHPRMAELTARAPAAGNRPVGTKRLVLNVACLAVPGILVVVSSVAGHVLSAGLVLAATIALAALALVRSVRLLRAKDSAQETLRRTSRYFEALAANSSDAVVVIDREGTIARESAALADLLGHPHDPTTADRQVWAFVHGDDRAEADALLAKASAAPGQVCTAELRVRHGDGSWHWIAARVVDLFADPDVGAVVANLHDVTARKQVEMELNHLAFHDSLTGLANRALFRDRVEHALDRRLRRRTESAVLFLDLDGFKIVNDSLGHDSGDELLRTVATRLREAVRTEDTVARLGGDEFAVLIESDGGADEAIAVADRILRSLATPVVVAGTTALVGGSIGIAISGPESRADELLRDADVAMYQAKAAGKGRWILFYPGMGRAAVERLELEGDLLAAIDGDQLMLRYQPVIELETGQLAGFEALIRWRHPTLGLLRPDRFIPLAEENGLIVPIGRWVAREACRQAAEWHRAFPREHALTMAVNISARQLLSPDLVGDIADALADSGLAPSTLTLEMTETALVKDPQIASTRLHELRELGVRLAIDDFGTGFSSLSYLQQFPVDVLKIDRSFINTITASEQMPAIVRGLLELSNTLGLEVIAEGIELEVQLDHLKHERCRFGQGYLFSPPLRGADAETHLTDAVAAGLY